MAKRQTITESSIPQRPNRPSIHHIVDEVYRRHVPSTEQASEAIHYDASAVARMVSFCLISPNPRIQRETGERMRTLRAVAAGKKRPSSAVLQYFQLTPNRSRVCA